MMMEELGFLYKPQQHYDDETKKEVGWVIILEDRTEKVQI
jgi:hypothetical protein